MLLIGRSSLVRCVTQRIQPGCARQQGRASGATSTTGAENDRGARRRQSGKKVSRELVHCTHFAGRLELHDGELFALLKKHKPHSIFIDSANVTAFDFRQRLETGINLAELSGQTRVFYADPQAAKVSTDSYDEHSQMPTYPSPLASNRNGSLLAQSPA